MKDVKLVICDLDGTLFDWSNRSLSKKNKEIMDYLHNKGVYLALGSGRSVAELIKYKEDWGLDYQFDFFIGMNGSELYCTKTKEQHNYFWLKKEWIKELLEFMKQWTCNPMCYLHDDKILFRDFDDMMKRSIASSNRKGIQVKDDSEFYHEENAKIMFRMKEDVTPIVEKYLEEHPFKYYKGFKTQATLMEFMDKRCSKGFALKKLCEQYNIDIEDVVAYGDTTNDNEMLKVAGLGVCLKNGSDDTKAIADEITEYGCMEDGFAHHVEERLFPIINKAI